jgi:hypothetical protein
MTFKESDNVVRSHRREYLVPQQMTLLQYFSYSTHTHDSLRPRIFQFIIYCQLDLRAALFNKQYRRK